jgi:putative addiction module component (TIGR02574 family)
LNGFELADLDEVLVMIQSIDLSGIKALSIPERILVVEEIWDTIAAEQDSIPIIVAQRDELDRRLRSLESDPNLGSAWPDVKARIQQRH